jgi:type IV secretion system protein TrbE
MALLSEALPWSYFLDGNHANLRGRGVLEGFWMDGPPPDTTDDAELIDCAEQYSSAINHLGSGDSIQVVWDRNLAPHPPEQHYEHRAAQMVHDERIAEFDSMQRWVTPCRLYLTHQYAPPVTSIIQAVMAGANSQHRSNKQILQDFALGRFATFRDAVKGAIKLRPMTQEEMFNDWFQLVTYNQYRLALPEPGTRLNKVIGMSERQINGTKPRIGQWELCPIVISHYPGQTTAQMLKEILALPGHLTLSVRFTCMDPHEAQAEMEGELNFWGQVMMRNWISIFKAAIAGKEASDRDADEQINEIKEEAIPASRGGAAFGHMSVVAIAREYSPNHDRGLVEHRAHEIVSMLNNKKMMARIEDDACGRLIANTWPGYIVLDRKEYQANRHKILMTGENMACVTLPATYWEGSRTIDSELYSKDTPTPFVIAGDSAEPFFWPTHDDGVGHQFWFGPTGVGKTAIIWDLLSSLLSIPNSRISALDYGYSSYIIGQLLDAAYYSVGDTDAVPLCPLAVLDQPNGLQYLTSWFKRLFKRWDLELRERQWDDFRAKLAGAKDGTNYKGEPMRQLIDFRGLIQPGQHDDERIREILQQYILAPELGGFGHIFNGVSTEHPDQRVVIYEMSKLGRDPQITDPATELILHNIGAKNTGKHPHWIFVDEAHRQLRDPIGATELEQTIREWRRLNCSAILCTQSTVEVAKSPIRDILLDQMAALVFLPNKRAKDPLMAQALADLGLTPNEISCIAGAVPRSELIIKTKKGVRKVRIRLGPVAQAVCGSTAYPDVLRARQVFANISKENYIDEWLREKGVSGIPTQPSHNGRGVLAIDDQHPGNGIVRRDSNH